MIKRLALAVLVIASVSIITFVVARVLPADPARTWVGPRATAEQLKRAHELLGLDLPLPVQYARYVSSLLNMQEPEAGSMLERAHEMVVEILARDTDVVRGEVRDEVRRYVTERLNILGEGGRPRERR